MAQRVKRPEFSWWPYRAVAIAVPLLALGAAVGAQYASMQNDGTAQTTEMLTVFFALLGAGNAYLFAIAIGDLGKAVIAVPIGGFAGFLAVRLFGYPVATQIYLGLAALLILRSLWTGLFNLLLGCGGVLITGTVFLVLLSANQNRYEPGLSLFCSYPFICGAVAACMPYDRTFAGVRSAWMAGTLNALAGMIYAAGACFIFAFLMPFSLVFGRQSNAAEVLAGLGLAVVLSVANYICAKRLFVSVYRVSDVPVSEESDAQALDAETRSPTPPGNAEVAAASTASPVPPPVPDSPSPGAHNNNAST